MKHSLAITLLLLLLLSCRTQKTVTSSERTTDTLYVTELVHDSLVQYVALADTFIVKDSVVIYVDSAGNALRTQAYHSDIQRSRASELKQSSTGRDAAKVAVRTVCRDRSETAIRSPTLLERLQRLFFWPFALATLVLIGYLYLNHKNHS